MLPGDKPFRKPLMKLLLYSVPGVCSEFDHLTYQVSPAHRHQTHQPEALSQIAHQRSQFFLAPSVLSFLPVTPQVQRDCVSSLGYAADRPFPFKGNNKIHWPEEESESMEIGLQH